MRVNEAVGTVQRTDAWDSVQRATSHKLSYVEQVAYPTLKTWTTCMASYDLPTISPTTYPTICHMVNLYDITYNLSYDLYYGLFYELSYDISQDLIQLWLQPGMPHV